MGKTATSERLSLRSSDATEGGGTEGALATIKEIEFIPEFDYNGTVSKQSAALRVLLGIDDFPKPWEQHYTVGPSKNFEVIDSGNGIKSLGKAEGLNKGSNAAKFLLAAEKAAGYDGFHDDGSVEAYEGKRVRLTNLKYETQGGDQKEMIVIAAFVDDEAPVKGKGSAKAKASSADAISNKTDAAIMGLLEDTPKIKKKDLPNAVFEANKEDGDVRAMMQLCFKEAWVGSEDRPFTWDRKKDVITEKGA